MVIRRMVLRKLAGNRRRLRHGSRMEVLEGKVK